ncbi:MAG TPA: winged helix DNA-binding domain-containing protein [Streptosporangiaceae bacterium]|nr:winged helix DNA-binding domain-containing protein [Streptosporangiaceae bacterium]
MTADWLSVRALNRATLDRQLLLRRDARPARQAIEQLTALQAQAPLAPYVGLWTRLSGFRHEALEDLLTERSVVRAHLLRNTVHLVTAEDFLSFRALFQPLMQRGLAGNFGRNLTGVDLAELQQEAADLLTQGPLTRPQLASRLAERWPGRDPASLAHAATHLLPLVQVPPRGLWSLRDRAGPAAFALASAWLADPGRTAVTPPDPGRTAVTPPDPGRALEQLVLRYLGAYGPASVRDIQAWSGLSRLREVTDRLGPRLRPFTGPGGARLLDLADAPRPDPDAPAPPRFLPEYDNLLLSFADRSRVIPHGRPVPLPPGHGATTGTLLVDGFWQADWKITKGIKGPDRAVLHILPFQPLGPAQASDVAAEGSRLLEFAAPAAAHDVRISPPGGRPPGDPPPRGLPAPRTPWPGGRPPGTPRPPARPAAGNDTVTHDRSGS